MIKKSAVTTEVAGTRGYIDPEAWMTGRYTDRADVYALGAFALEIACGRSAFLSKLPPQEILLVDWVWERLSDENLLSTVDKCLKLALDEKDWVEVVLKVGLWCSHPDANARPSMRQVLEVLRGTVKVPSIPASKPKVLYSYTPQSLLFSEQSQTTGLTSCRRAVTTAENCDNGTVGADRRSVATI
jgi:serine/threonine protein kinase